MTVFDTDAHVEECEGTFAALGDSAGLAAGEDEGEDPHQRCALLWKMSSA
jgi:hypothetical protein